MIKEQVHQIQLQSMFLKVSLILPFKQFITGINAMPKKVKTGCLDNITISK